MMLATVGLLMFLSGSAVTTWAELAGLCRTRRRVLPTGIFHES